MIEIRLFPTLIGEFHYDKKIKEDELTFLSNLERKDNMINHSSKNSSVLEENVVKDIREFIQNSVDEYFETAYNPKYDVKLRITQSWCNYTSENEGHHQHRHPNSLVSGVFYIDADPNCDKIVFYNPKLYNTIEIPVNEYADYNSQTWWLPIQSGKLIIFPSHLEHSVDVKKNENNTRISLAFNTFPVGNIGDESQFTGLKL